MEPNSDRLTNKIQTLDPLDVERELQTARTGLSPQSRIISSVAPVAVRRDDPAGARYQEALGYTFLVNSPKFPGLARTDDGTLVLTVSASLQLTEQGKREGRILFSTDDGKSWSQPARIPIQRCTPVSLGGDRLMFRGYLGQGNDDKDVHALLFSKDGGATWDDSEPIPPLPDGREYWTDTCLNPLVEGDDVTFGFYTKRHDVAKDEWNGVTLLRTYDAGKHTWDDPTFLPETFRSSEGAIARAKNGDLVVALRTGRPGMPSSSDHWRGLSTTRSADNGKTWTAPDIHFRYGHHHQSLQVFPDGRILMTYAARVGELEGRTYHGIEAVLSHDNGVTWDWGRRFILFRWPNETMHSPQSAQLSDGRIITVFLHHTSFTWHDGERTWETNNMNLGNVSMVIWTP